MCLVIVALSGGVDSAVAAILLKEQGHNIHAIHMQNGDPDVNGEKPNLSDTKGCANKDDLLAAQSIAEKLNIPLKVYNFVPEYGTEVFAPFLDSLKNRELSNPDVFCNSKIKFGVLLRQLKKDFSEDIKLATGHYARIIKKKDKCLLGVCDNLKKDQTYFLSRLNQDQLKNIMFPLENFDDKTKVREIAQKYNLDIGNKVDSRGICFIGKRNFKQFIQNYVKLPVGKILDIENNQILGKHDGISFYALHQRFGLNISGQSEKYYVCKKDYETNTIGACKKSQIPQHLYRTTSIVKDLWGIDQSPKIDDSLLIKTKHGERNIEVLIKKIDKEQLTIEHEHQFMTTGGQFIVFYSLNNQICLGSGIYQE